MEIILIAFVVGVLVGAPIGFMAAAIMSAASDAERHCEDLPNKHTHID